MITPLPRYEAVVASSAKASMTAPTRAKRGSHIRVKASGLRKGVYGLTLVAPSAPDHDSYCQATLATTTHEVTKLSVRVKLPSRVTCYSGYPALEVGSIAVTPGEWGLTVGPPMGDNSTHDTVKHQKIKIT